MSDAADDSFETIFSDIALVGPSLFYERAFSADELAARFAGPTPETARDYVVLRTLAEVQMFGVSARRWQAIEATLRPGDKYDAVEAESLALARAASQRRLLEALVTLINFSTTNDNTYYNHFLSLQELDRRRRRITDERDFFGGESELTRRNVDTLKRDVDAAYPKLAAPAQCWYLKRGEFYKIASFRSQYLVALKTARASETNALGYTYDLSFGSASARLHFGVSNSAEASAMNGAAVALCGLLAIGIIARAHDLCEVEPTGINKHLAERAQSASLWEALAPPLATGDFVLTTGPHIGEICEIRTTPFGYTGCRVRFLDDASGPGITEDWLPALAVRPFMTRKEFLDGIQKRFAEHGMSDHEFTADDIVCASRQAVVEAWRLGLGDYFRRQVESQQKLSEGSADAKATLGRGDIGAAPSDDPT
jgi:hypothetical protein